MSDITQFHAEEKRHTSTAGIPYTGKSKKKLVEAALQQHEENVRRSNLSQAAFVERFSERIVELQADMRMAGAEEDVTKRPLWTFYNWPDVQLTDIGVELLRLEHAENEQEK